MLRLFIQEAGPFMSVIAQLISPLAWTAQRNFLRAQPWHTHVLENKKNGRNILFLRYEIFEPPRTHF